MLRHFNYAIHSSKNMDTDYINKCLYVYVLIKLILLLFIFNQVTKTRTENTKQAQKNIQY